MAMQRRMLVRSGSGEWVAPDVSKYDNEAHLQSILAEHPTWIPGVYEGALTATELSTSAGPIDVCVVGRDGELTVVECKLASNSERRRMVIGQVIDYASALSSDGPQTFIDNWNRSEPQKELADCLEPAAFERLTANLTSAQVDLCLAVDSIDSDLRRLIEYLNKVTRASISVTAIELSYAKQGSLEIIVPRTYGAELAEAKSRSAGQQAVNWTVETFVESLSSEQDRAFARSLIERTESASGPRSKEALWFGKRPGGGIYLHPGGVVYPPVWLGGNGERRLTVCGTWKMYTRIANLEPFAELAGLLGQDFRLGAKGILAETLDLDALWQAVDACARELHANETS